MCVCVCVSVTAFLLNLCSCCYLGLWLKNDSFSNLVTLLEKTKHPNFLFCFQSLKSYPSNSWILSLCKWVKWYRVKTEVFLQPSKGKHGTLVIFVLHIFQQMGTCGMHNLTYFFYLMVCLSDFFYVSTYVYVYLDFKNNCSVWLDWFFSWTSEYTCILPWIDSWKWNTRSGNVWDTHTHTHTHTHTLEHVRVCVCVCVCVYVYTCF